METPTTTGNSLLWWGSFLLGNGVGSIGVGGVSTADECASIADEFKSCVAVPVGGFDGGFFEGTGVECYSPFCVVSYSDEFVHCVAVVVAPPCDGG